MTRAHGEYLSYGRTAEISDNSIMVEMGHHLVDQQN